MKDQPMQAMNLCAQTPAPTGPYGIAIFELEVMRDVAYNDHDVAIRESRYDDAKRLNERVKSIAKAIHLLTAADKVHTEA